MTDLHLKKLIPVIETIDRSLKPDFTACIKSGVFFCTQSLALSQNFLLTCSILSYILAWSQRGHVVSMLDNIIPWIIVWGSIIVTALTAGPQYAETPLIDDDLMEDDHMVRHLFLFFLSSAALCCTSLHQENHGDFISAHILLARFIRVQDLRAVIIGVNGNVAIYIRTSTLLGPLSLQRGSRPQAEWNACVCETEKETKGLFVEMPCDDFVGATHAVFRTTAAKVRSSPSIMQFHM